MAISAFRLYLFGNPRIYKEEKEVFISRRKSLGLLAYIAISEIKMSRSQLCCVLWPEKDESHARGALRTTLSTLNSEMNCSLINSEGEYFSLSKAVWTDVNEFQKKIRKLNNNILFDEEVLLDLRDAVDLYKGDFLSGFFLSRGSVEFEDWQYMHLENLRKSCCLAFERLIQSYTLLSRFKTATQFAEKWSILEPENEQVHRKLMELYAWQGRRRDALHQFEKCTRNLKREMDQSPEESTLRLYNSIKNKAMTIPETIRNNERDIPDFQILDSSVFYTTILSVGLTNSADKLFIQRPYDTASLVDILLHRSIEETLYKHSVNGWYFIGDGLVSLFGIPNSAADDSYRSLMAAIEILQVASGFGFSMTAGISTGLVYFRTDDSKYKNSSIIGPAVIEANLLRFYGEPGMIFIENATWTNLKDSAVFEKQKRNFPGLDRTKEVYRLKMDGNKSTNFI